MQWPYSFASSPEQATRRRELLDSYARLAQTSILLPFLAIYLLKLYHQTSQRDHPDISTSRLKVGKWTYSKQRVTWWLDEPVIKGWSTRGKVLLLGSWGIWMSVCILAGTGNGESSESNFDKRSDAS